jgi:hypothetical protein
VFSNIDDKLKRHSNKLYKHRFSGSRVMMRRLRNKLSGLFHTAKRGFITFWVTCENGLMKLQIFQAF